MPPRRRAGGPSWRRALAAARAALDGAADAERRAGEAREAARAAADEAEAARQAAAERAAALGSALAAQRGRLEALAARLVEEESRGIARAAKRRGGRRLDEELVVEPGLRAAVEAALDEAARAYLVNRDAVGELASERGMLVVADRAAATGAAGGSGERRFLDRVADLGGTPLADAVRRDPTGAVTRLLGRAVATPDLEAALALQPLLPAGWMAVVRDGSAVVGEFAVRFGRGDAPLERRADAERLRGEVDRLEAEAAAAGEASALRRRPRRLLERPSTPPAPTSRGPPASVALPRRPSDWPPARSRRSSARRAGRRRRRSG